MNDAAGAAAQEFNTSPAVEQFADEMVNAKDCVVDWVDTINGENDDEDDDFETMETVEDKIAEDFEVVADDFDDYAEVVEDVEEEFEDEFAEFGTDVVVDDGEVAMVTLESAPVMETSTSYTTMGLFALVAASLAGSFYAIKKVKKNVFRTDDDDNMYNKISANLLEATNRV